MGGECGMLGHKQDYIQVLMGNLTERDQLGDPDIRERIILKWNLQCELVCASRRGLL
jgi:hypothetical protein